MEKKQYHHGDLKNDLINKGLQLLNKDGYDGFSLRKVAALCEVSHAAPYKHFKNKDELIAAISQTVVNNFKNTLYDITTEFPNDPKKQIIEMGKEYVRFMVDNPDHLKFLFMSDFSLPVELDKESFNHKEDCPFNVFEKSAIQYLESINSDSKDHAINVLTMWGMVHGLAVLLVNNSIKFEGNCSDLVEKILSEKLKFQ
ncbi:TetR/AcrR family transcriptional regulator [Vallitalea okinawensis]|uniref:TetR/AcrR family transcriptional regulator n=1 Tax=Vallitalea okinawensis TaxID=2078660 RepID=UPI001FA93ABC|nr:TetR/AcrR family transcriptional regulator [Vallitalea okinawensis]